MKKIYKLNVLTCRSQVLNPAGLRRFPSPLFFLDFLWNFRAQMRREGEGWSFYRGDTPVARGVGGATGPPAAPVGWAQRWSPVGWATGPCRPLGGRQGLFFQGPHCEFEKKNLHLRAVALWVGDRGYF